jgi:hypothetical protein
MFGSNKVREVPYDGRSYVWPEPAKSVSFETENWSEANHSKVATKTPVEEPVSKVVKSRIRVQLSRPLTWAEKEWLETDKLDPHSRRIDGSEGLKVWVSPNKEHVWAEEFLGSRVLFELVAAVLEEAFVNVFPKAVRTFREYNGE